jgi:tetratricopeptide (TPR) repeat protein
VDKTMDLSKFIQQDIIDYLEEKTSEQREELGKLRSEEISIFSIEKDYAKETEQALAEENYNKAKKIFEELRVAYNTNKGNEEEKDKIYTILEEVYNKIKEKLRGKSNLEEDLLAFEKGMESIKEENNNFDTAATEEEEERQIHNTELKKIMLSISNSLENEDANKAIEAYDQLKKAFELYPAEDKYRKLEWYNQVLLTYEQIKKLQKKKEQQKTEEEKKKISEKQEEEKKKISEKQEEEEKKKNIEQQQIEEEKKREEEEQKKQEEEKAKKQLASQELKSIKEEIKALIESLDQGDIKKTANLLIDAKHKVTKLGKEYEKEKNALESILATANNRIVFMKQEEDRKKAAENREQNTVNRTQTPEHRPQNTDPRTQRTEHDKQITESGTNADELYHKGLVHQHQGNNEEAKACYRAVLKISPNHLPAQIRIEQIKEGEKRA